MAKKKDVNFKIIAEEVMHFGLSVSKDGYKSARILIKKGDKEYMHIGYEWEGEGVPDFVMSLMGFVQANQEDIDTAQSSLTDEDKEYAKNKFGADKKKE